MEIALGIILIIISVALIVTVLLQSGKNKSLSGAIAGGSDTFFNKSGAKNKKDKMMSTITGVLAVLFVVIVLVMYVTQDTKDNYNGNYDTPAEVTATTTAE